MSAHPTDGGPAFPQPENMDGTYADPTTCKQFMPYRGLSLRDYFAAKALSACEVTAVDNMAAGSFWYEPKKLANRCYAIADAMLLAREAKR